MDKHYLKSRTEIPKYTKELKQNESCNVVKTNRTKLYEFYKCDYCGEEIVLNKKQHERSGGIVIFPHTLTRMGNITLALCNKCLNNAINEFKG